MHIYCYRCGERLRPSIVARLRYWTSALRDPYHRHVWVCDDCIEQQIKFGILKGDRTSHEH